MTKKLLIALLFAGSAALNAQTLNFTDKADMITPRAGISGGTEGNFEYIANGFSGPTPYLSSIEKYDFVNNSWSDLGTSVPTIAKRYSNGEVLAGKLYLFNGVTASGLNNKFEVVNLSTGNVSVAANLNPSPVYNAGSAVFGDYLLSFGGCTNQGTGAYSDKFYKIAPWGEWTQLASMPETMETKGAVVYGNGNNPKLYAFGGYREANSIYEDFQTIGTTGNLALPNWINVAETGTKLFQAGAFGTGRFAKVSAFSGTDQEPSNKIWLISPNIALAATNNVFLSFNTADAYNNGSTLQAYVITNWTGDIATSTKMLLADAIISSGHTSAIGDFINSGQISLTGLPNNFRIAFKYTGGYNPVATALYELDEIRVYQQQTSNKIRIYDFNTNQWSTSATTLPSGISAHSVVVDDIFSNAAKIYVTGDYSNQTFLGMFNTATGAFTTISQTNMVGRRHHKAGLFGNKLYLFGGNTNPDNFSTLTSTQSADLAALGTTEFQHAQAVSFYPNPATDKITFSSAVKNVLLFTFEGRKIEASLRNNELDVSGLSRGTYLIQGINQDGSRFSDKLIKK